MNEDEEQEWKDVQYKRWKNKKCINCGEKGPHFVPPSLGEPGFFHCTQNKERIKKDESK